MIESKQISEARLKEIFDNNDPYFPLDKLLISDFVSLDLTKCEMKQIHFNNCTFESAVEIILGSKFDIKFRNCKFESHFIISSENNSDGESRFVIVDSVFDYFTIKQVALTHFKLIDSEFRDIEIIDLKCIKCDFSLDKIILKESLSINNLDSDKKLQIQDSSIGGALDIENSKLELLDLQRTEISDDLTIDKCKFNLAFDRLIVKGTSSIDDSSILIFHIESSTFSKQFVWEFYEENKLFSVLALEKYGQKWLVNKITLVSSSFKGGFIFGSDMNETNFIPVRYLGIECTSNTQGDVFLSNVEIDRCYFRGINKDGSFIFNNCSFTLRLSFYRFINFGRLLLSGKSLTNKSRLYFQETILGSANFIGVDFKNIDQFNFYDSDISNINFSSTKWMENLEEFNPPTTIERHGFSSDENSEDLIEVNLEVGSDEIFYSNRRELFRQLKNAAECQNDRIQSLKFQQLEMTAHRKVLALTKNANNYDRFVLALEWTNNYGQSWFRPFLFAVFGTALMALPISYYSHKDFLIGNYGWDSYRLSTYFVDFFQLLNPLHSLDKISPNYHSLSGWIFGLDYFQRLWMAFFIVQTVSGFRKFVKK